MEFYLLDVKSTVSVNGVDTAFDYCNTYYNCDKAIKEAKQLSTNEDVLDVSYICHHTKLIREKQQCPKQQSSLCVLV